MPIQSDLFEQTPDDQRAKDRAHKVDRRALVEQWFYLTRDRLPLMAKTHDWPIHLDHCFMRVLLDNACGGMWRDFVKAPAYRHAPLEVLQRAVALAEQVAAGEADMWELNRRSLGWRGKD